MCKPNYTVVHHNEKFYRVQVDSETGLVLDPITMYRKENEISKEEALKPYDK